MSAFDAEPLAPELIRPLLNDRPLKAAAFIVTIYGDVVEPRGGVLWMGNLITLCAEVGISESLVRTAVSRLVSAGQLVGEKAGRRSYYRLAPAARAEFAAASRVLFDQPEDGGWEFVHLSGDTADTTMRALERVGYARVAARLAVGPKRHVETIDGALVFEARAVSGHAELQRFAAEYWDLPAAARAYDSFVGSFSALAERWGSPPQLAGPKALTLRLLLVHAYRLVVLRDPRLPPAALPDAWPGEAARILFSRLYVALSRAADRHIAGELSSMEGPLPERSPAVQRRLAALGRQAGSAADETAAASL